VICTQSACFRLYIAFQEEQSSNGVAVTKRCSLSGKKRLSHYSDLARITLLFYLTTLPLAHSAQCRLSALGVKSVLKEIKEMFVAYFGVISEHSPGGIEKGDGKLQSGYSVVETKIRTRNLRNTSQNITA